MAKAKTTDETQEENPKKTVADKKAKKADEGNEAKSQAGEKKAGSRKRAAKKAAASEAEVGATAAIEAATESPATVSPAASAPSTLDGVALPAANGNAGVLGGPKDRGLKPDDKLALPVGKHFTYERVRSLNPKSFYCAMRWDYKILNKSPEEAKRWWANKKLLVTNPANGNKVVVRAVDFGPHETTGLTISLSPGALDALALEIGGEVQIEFADQKEPVGSKQ
ncbi:MAG: hypothetical protein AB1757_18010 [Acidobacteriota bacterium]